MVKGRNPLDWYSLTESVNSILNGLIALAEREQFLELKKPNPYSQRLKELTRLSDEVWAVNKNTENFRSLERMEEIIAEYSPILLAEKKKCPLSSTSQKALNSLIKLYAFRAEDYNILLQRIIARYTDDLHPVDQPVAIILGAQPGSGKIELEKVATSELGGNVVICNPDNLRDWHPHAETIKRNHEGHYPDLTTDCAQAWKNDLIAYCQENRLNFIVKTTFASGADINRIIQAIKDKDYRVELKLMAVHPRISFLNTQLRFEEMKVREGAGRIVTKAVHDDRYSKLIPTLLLVQSAALYDKMQIYGRNLETGNVEGN